MNKIDVFISRKSADAAMAKELYDYLTAKGLDVFESDETLPALGNSDYRKEIDKALDICTHMIVVGSSVEHLQSPWVEAEWGFYIAEKRAGRKNGNILSVISYNLTIEKLPPSLRNYEVIYYRKKNFERIYAYVSGSGNWAGIKKYGRPLFYENWFLPVIGLIGIGIALGYYFYNLYQPFDFTVFARPDKASNISSNYPALKEGSLSVYLNGKEETRELLSNGEVYFKQIPAEYMGKKIAVKLTANHWKNQTDSIIISKECFLPIVPDGSLGHIYGRVRNVLGNGIPDVQIQIGGDTVIMTNANGYFEIQLPYSMQHETYDIVAERNGMGRDSRVYYPLSGDIEIMLKNVK